MTYIVISVHSLGPHVPEWGMKENVFGCGKTIGWQVVSLSGCGLVPQSYGWIYPTRKMAQCERRRLMRLANRPKS